MTGESQSAIDLDTGQYTRKEIEKYEAVYGRNFVSPGGMAAAQEFTALLDLRPGQRVLDVGCGIGGSAFYMAQTYGVQVDGLDLSHNMLTIARERCPILEREAANLATTPLAVETGAELHRSWQNKITRAQRGEQRWGLFQARRPVE